MRIKSFTPSQPVSERLSRHYRDNDELPAFKPQQNDQYERRGAYLAMAGMAIMGAGAGYVAGATSNPWLGGSLGAMAGSSLGLTAAGFTPGTPFITLASAGAAAGALLGARVHHPAATAALTLAGATLPLGLIFGLMDGFE